MEKYWWYKTDGKTKGQVYTFDKMVNLPNYKEAVAWN